MKKGLIGVISAVVGAAVGAVTVGVIVSDQISKTTKMSDKHFASFMTMNRWVKVKLQGKELASYFRKNNYCNIAIYGMSYAGENLLEELEKTEITVAYGIDRNAANIYTEIRMYTLDDNLEEVDAIVVTPVYFFEEIKRALSEKMNCPIISLNDILYEI